MIDCSDAYAGTIWYELVLRAQVIHLGGRLFCMRLDVTDRLTK
jgi:hypothetical protein